jgi:hypothetical protein
METWHFVWMLAAVTGLVVAGLTGSFWSLLTGERPSLAMLEDFSPMAPLKGMALVVYAPLAVTRAGLTSIDLNPVFALIVAGIGLVWSFLQGVFIMTTFFGFT